MNQNRVLFGGLCLTTALLTIGSFSPAQAGFQWNPPEVAVQSPSGQPVPKTKTAAPKMPGLLTPMPGEPASAQPVPIEPVAQSSTMDSPTEKPPAAMSMPAPMPATQPGMHVINANKTAEQTPPSNAPVAPMPKEVPMPAPVAAKPPMMPATKAPLSTVPPTAPMSSDAVQGFGKDIPMAVALRQIVPPSYGISYQKGIDLGKPVSWTGGSSWSEVVNTTLAKLKLRATFDGKTVNVSDATVATMAPTAPAPAVNPPMAMAPPAMPKPAAPAMVAQNAKPVMPTEPVKPMAPLVVKDQSAMTPMAPPSSTITASLPKPVVDLNKKGHWHAKAGQTLQQTLESWTDDARVELEWQDQKDLPIKKSFNFDGTFDQALNALLSRYSDQTNKPHAKLYPNLPEGPSVLVIGSQ